MHRCMCTVVSIVWTMLCLGEMALCLVLVMGKRICGHKIYFKNKNKTAKICFGKGGGGGGVREHICCCDHCLDMNTSSYM